MLKTYKIRSFRNGANKDGQPFINYSITIPSKIAEVLPDDVQFTVELTEDGLLFRKADISESEVAVPSWAQGNGKAKAAPKAKPAAKTAAKPAPAKAPAKTAVAKEKAAAKPTARKRPTPAAKADKPAAAKASGTGRKRPGKAATA